MQSRAMLLWDTFAQDLVDLTEGLRPFVSGLCPALWALSNFLGALSKFLKAEWCRAFHPLDHPKAYLPAYGREDLAEERTRLRWA